MMRPLLSLFTAFLLLVASVAQAQQLPMNEGGKVSFYEVVKADSLPASLLYTHAKSWLRRRSYALAVADSANGRLVASNAFGVYDRGYLTKKLHGKMHYNLTVEVKDGRYRLQSTDFVFAYYQEDHAYHQVPTGKTKPLEDPTATGWQKLWETHRKDTLLTMNSLSAELKTAMLAAPKAPAPARSLRSADW